ncbi:sugar ABC transporter permease [Sutcliffiella horikoshii]|uniref:carbohydrate ABC transporter permease n=1 Tax=Sutcliffiella horikoshii TaxID=79883 RepID=UPI0007D091F0|nr:sugar ABC transporter permease [Sutcliffiella horikoshii]MCM3618885.1 sugar ABC transporter permease [Sutcliffiella horikoshii]
MKQLSMRSKNTLTGLMFISPWILGFLLFTAYPLFYSLYLSFQKVRITTEGIQTTFVKFDNYKDAFTVDALFTQKLLTFVQELVLSVPIIIVFSLIIAILLNQPIRFRNFFRMIFFLPVIIASGPVINELISQGVTSIPSIKDYAVFETMLSADSIFSSVLLYLMDNLIIILWFSGVQFLIFLAALQKIDTQVYEAAKIDGASNWECFWKVTLPSIFPMIVVNTVYTIVTFSIFSLNPVIDHIQTNMFQINTGFGYASALSWIYFLLIAAALAISVALLTVRGKKNYA